MTALAFGLVCGTSGFALGALLGYGIPRLFALSVARAVERERVVAGLAGQSMPSWEKTATALEQMAVKQAARGNTFESGMLLDQAANLRKRGGG